jgi:hypothetical protein
MLVSACSLLASVTACMACCIGLLPCQTSMLPWLPLALGCCGSCQPACCCCRWFCLSAHHLGCDRAGCRKKKKKNIYILGLPQKQLTGNCNFNEGRPHTGPSHLVHTPMWTKSMSLRVQSVFSHDLRMPHLCFLAMGALVVEAILLICMWPLSAGHRISLRHPVDHLSCM